METPSPPDKRTQRRIEKFERHVVEEIHLEDTHVGRKEVARERWAEIRAASVWLGLWILLTVAGIVARGAWPPDETRVLGIGWEMWARGKLLIPYLNGEPELYPPFFFWLLHLGWAAFGVVDWWARLVAPLGALASLFVTQRLARVLWSGEPEVARLAPVLLLGAFGFALAASASLPGTWTLCFVLVAYWALLIQWRHRDMRAWLLLAPALGLGMLTAGLVVLLYVLPVAIAAPLWARAPRPEWKYWYVDLLKALAAAGVMVALWLGAAGAAEGTPYVVRFLAHAVVPTRLETFPLQQPWWWYAWLLPLVLLPWSVFPLAWLRLWYIRREPLDSGFVFCLIAVVLPLAVLSVLPLKQPQLLLPLIPAGTLLTSRLLFTAEWRDVYQDNPIAGMAIPLLLAGGVLTALPRLPRVDFLPAILWSQSSWVGLAIMGVGIASAWLPFKNVRRRVFDIAGVCVVLVVLLLFVVAGPFDKFYRTEGIAQVLAGAQERGRPVAYVGDYRGEFHFAGRLRAPLHVIDAARAPAWIEAHPEGVIMTYDDAWLPRGAGRIAPLAEGLFRERQVHVFESIQVLSIPGGPGS